MWDRFLFDRLDKLVIYLHDRGVSRTPLMRGFLLLTVAAIALRYYVSHANVLHLYVVFTALVLLIFQFFDEWHLKRGAKEKCAANLRIRAVLWARYNRVFIWALVLIPTDALPMLPDLFMFPWMVYYYLLFSYVPHDPPRRKKREESVKLAWTPAG